MPDEPRRRCPAGPSACPSPRSTSFSGAAWCRHFPKARTGPLRPGLLLGGREGILGGRGSTAPRWVTRRATPRTRPTSEVCTRPHRPQRGGARRLRPREVTYTKLLRALLGKPRSDAGNAPGQRRGHPVPLRHLRLRRRAAESGRGVARRLPERAHAEGHGTITTEIFPRPEFYYAEEYHQQYLAKNPGGYCGHGGTGSELSDGRAAVGGRRSPKCPRGGRRRAPPARLRLSMSDSALTPNRGARSARSDRAFAGGRRRSRSRSVRRRARRPRRRGVGPRRSGGSFGVVTYLLYVDHGACGRSHEAAVDHHFLDGRAALRAHRAAGGRR